MHLQDFQREFVKRAQRIGLAYDIWPSATDEQLRETERRLTEPKKCTQKL